MLIIPFMQVLAEPYGADELQAHAFLIIKGGYCAKTTDDTGYNSNWMLESS